jgi:hypothetical protein
MQFLIQYKIPVDKHRHQTNNVPVDVAPVTNIQWLLSQATPDVQDSINAANDPHGPSKIGTLNRAQLMFPDADAVLFA